MHHIYTTPAFVVHSTPYGEAGKFLLLFTRDFGMIGAVAQGVRSHVSKLKYHLQDSHFSTISVVRGKEVWRITGAYGMESAPRTPVHNRVLKLLKRLLQGEEKNESLFNLLAVFYETPISSDLHHLLETLTVLRIVATLGYAQKREELLPYINSHDISPELLHSFEPVSKIALQTINKALKESHL